jgi:hypothetical protein
LPFRVGKKLPAAAEPGRGPGSFCAERSKLARRTVAKQKATGESFRHFMNNLLGMDTLVLESAAHFAKRRGVYPLF